MTKYYKKKTFKGRKVARIFSLILSLIGVAIFLYVAFPVISWQIYFAPIFASQSFEVPIPKTAVTGGRSIAGLLSNAAAGFSVDYTNAENWYPDAQFKKLTNLNYSVSIPKINVADAKVSSADRDLTKHMVQFNTDTAPSQKGNTLIFGHSTLPQLYNPNDYKTILANASKLGVGDSIFVNMGKVSYHYKVQSIIVVEPNDTSVLAQDFSDSFITLITCTPPGTIWKRLVIKARLSEL